MARSAPRRRSPRPQSQGVRDQARAQRRRAWRGRRGRAARRGPRRRSSRSSARSASPSRTASARSLISRPNRWDSRSDETVIALAPGQAVDEVGEHRARLDRRELVGVADEHQPAVGPHRLHQPGHHRQRDHRGLVDHDHVVGQPVAAVVAEAVAAAAPPAQEPVERLRGRLADRRGVPGEPRARPAPCGRPPAAGPRPCRSGAVSAIRSRRSDWSASRASSPATAVVLPVPGPPVRTVVHCRAAATAAARCSSYPCGNSTGASASSRASSTAGGGEREPGGQVVAHLALLAPVAVEVGDGCPRRAAPRPPRAGWRRTRPTQSAPGQASPVGQRLGDQVGEVEADRPVAQRPHGQRERERDVVVGLARERLDPAGRVGVGGLDDAGRVEATEHAGHAQREASVARVVGLEGLDHLAPERAHESFVACHPPPSSRSLKAVTSAAGGDQSKTPATWPSTTGVSGPHIPRRNR